MHIVFFDSGVGGLTVLAEAVRLMPNEKYLYYADTDNVPYGTKDRDEIKNLVFQAISKLDTSNIKALVVACNTATSVAVNDLRKEYEFPIIGMEPAIKPASQLGSKNVLICATDSTLRQRKLKQLILDLKIETRIKMLSLQELVLIAEHYNFHDIKTELYLRDQFKSINWENYDAIVLGCTHFLFFKDLIQKCIPKGIQIFDGNRGTVKRLMSLITLEKYNKKVEPIKYMQSGRMCSKFYFDHYFKFYLESIK